MANLTWAEIKDAAGDPIVLISFWNDSTKKIVGVTTDMLPPATQVLILNFLNGHLP